MTDSHCHLDRLEDPLEGIDPGLVAIITVGTRPDRNEAAIRLAAEHDNVWAAVGIHPADAGLASSAANVDRLTEQARQPRVVAIGETGFDTHWVHDQLEQQHLAFDLQAQLASDLNLPLILHVRDRQGGRTASQAACSALRASGWPKGILHCFNGDAELLETGLELGWHVSFAGNTTYRNASAIQEAARQVPLDRLLVETDSPYLAPVPKRGRKNLPIYVTHTLEFIAGLRQVEPHALEEATDLNASAVFGLAVEGKV